MGSIFSPPPSPSLPPVPTAPAMPEQDDSAMEEARRLARRRALASRGRSSTILTSGLGASGTADVSRSTMLGGNQRTLP